ncbi:hypothetical protein R1flu_004430 [Riccia fluitans]|uniref:Phytase-like domain-containing protein n=1 Tax=Riccia fluitans TaxID=41844 RepID=A0ABD1YQ97_9MARC
MILAQVCAPQDGCSTTEHKSAFLRFVTMASQLFVCALLLLVWVQGGVLAQGGRRLLTDSCDGGLNRPPTPPSFGGTAQGPSSSQDVYMVPYTAGSGIFTKAIISVGDSALNNYTMVGIPDGLGAYDNGNGTMTVVMNHELSAGKGIIRAHGSNGAFVSKWIIQKNDFSVLYGEDLIKQVYSWDRNSKTYLDPSASPPVQFNRFCSATLAPESNFYNPSSGKGFKDLIFFNGEEDGFTGRAFAHIVTGPFAGTSYELPYMGQAGWENVSPHTVLNGPNGDKTIVIGTDDGGHNRVFVYVGDKKASGNPVEKAGLTGGKLYVIYVEGLEDEVNQGANLTVHSTMAFKAVLLGDGDLSGTSGTGPQIQANFLPANNVAPLAFNNTKFNRPEDGAWDPKIDSDFYFITTASFSSLGQHTRLWRLRFNDPTLQTSLEGTIEILINGPDGSSTAGPKMLDNIAVTKRGEFILQEDPGSNPHIARMWRYNRKTDVLDIIAQHNPAFFSPPTPVKTIDEESSGVINVDKILGRGWYLFDVQSHNTLPDPLVQDGQLLALYVPTGDSECA